MVPTHNFATTSFEVVAADLNCACDWLSSLGCGLSPTRVATYQTDIRELARDYNSDRATRLTREGRFEQLLNSIFEATELIAIHKGLRDHPEEPLVPKLKELASGPAYSTRENPGTSSNRPRNTSYELFTAARFAAAGYDIDLSTEADIIARKGSLVLYVECKRPQSPHGVNSNSKDALRQLRKRYDASDSPTSARGMVALSINKAVPVATQVLRSPNEYAAGAELQRVVNQFLEDNEGRWRNLEDQRTIAVMLDFRALAILSGPNLITTGHESAIKVLKCLPTDEANVHALWAALRHVGQRT